MKTTIFKSLYFQVLTAITLGILLGHFYPDLGAEMKPLGDGFVKLIKMIIAPVIFCTVVTGIAGMRDLGSVGRVAAKAFAYFLVFSTLALIVGLIIANIVRPGAGLNIDPASLDGAKVAGLLRTVPGATAVAFLMHPRQDFAHHVLVPEFLRRGVAVTDLDNHASQRVARRIGMHHVGRARVDDDQELEFFVS